MRFTRREIISLISICFGSFLIILDTNIVNIIIPVLKTQLDLTISQSSWVINSYVLTFASLILLFARLSKRIGAKNAFLTGITIFMIGSLFCGLSSSYYELIVSRIIQGIGAALFAPIATTILSSTVIEPRKRTFAFAIWSGTSGTAFAFSPMVGGFLNEAFGWESIFFINVPFTLLVIMTAVLAIKDIKKEKISMFIKEQFMIFSFILTFVYFTHDYEILYHFPILLSLGVLVLLLIGWNYSVKLKKNLTKVIQIQMFTKGNISSLINGFTYNFSIYGIMYLISLYFQEDLTLSALETGIKFLPLTLSGMLISSFLSPIFVNKLGTTITQKLCLSTIMMGSLLLIIYFSVSAVPFFIPISFILLGFSGTIAPVLMNSAFLATPEMYQNEISSLVNLVRQSGSILGVLIASILLNLFTKEMSILYFLILTIFFPVLAYYYLTLTTKFIVKKPKCHKVKTIKNSI